MTEHFDDCDADDELDVSFFNSLPSAAQAMVVGTTLEGSAKPWRERRELLEMAISLLKPLGCESEVVVASVVEGWTLPPADADLDDRIIAAGLCYRSASKKHWNYAATLMEEHPALTSRITGIAIKPRRVG